MEETRRGEERRGRGGEGRGRGGERPSKRPLGEAEGIFQSRESSKSKKKERRGRKGRVEKSVEFIYTVYI